MDGIHVQTRLNRTQVCSDDLCVGIASVRSKIRSINVEQAVSLRNINRPNTCSCPDIQNRMWGRTDGSQMQLTLEQKKINMVHYIQPVLLSLVIRDSIFSVKGVSPRTTNQRRKHPLPVIVRMVSTPILKSISTPRLQLQL